MSELTKVEDWLENGLSKLERKMPSAIVAAADKALQYINNATLFLDSKVVVDFAATPIVPEAEVAREAILTILANLQKAFTAVDNSFKPGLIQQAGSMITSTVHGSPISVEASNAAFLNASVKAKS